MEVLYVTPFLIGLVLMIYVFAASDDITGVSLELPLACAEYLAKALKRRALVCVGVSGALITYGLVNDDLISMMKFSSPVYVLVLAGAIQRWIEGARAQRLLGKGNVICELRGEVVLVHRENARVPLRAPRALLARARKRGLPEARL